MSVISDRDDDIPEDDDMGTNLFQRYDEDDDYGCGDSYCHICGDGWDGEFPDDEEDEG